MPSIESLNEPSDCEEDPYVGLDANDTSVEDIPDMPVDTTDGSVAEDVPDTLSDVNDTDDADNNTTDMSDDVADIPDMPSDMSDAETDMSVSDVLEEISDIPDMSFDAEDADVVASDMTEDLFDIPDVSPETSDAETDTSDVSEEVPDMPLSEDSYIVSDLPVDADDAESEVSDTTNETDDMSDIPDMPVDSAATDFASDTSSVSDAAEAGISFEEVPDIDTVFTSVDDTAVDEVDAIPDASTDVDDTESSLSDTSDETDDMPDVPETFSDVNDAETATSDVSNETDDLFGIPDMPTGVEDVVADVLDIAEDLFDIPDMSSDASDAETDVSDETADMSDISDIPVDEESDDIPDTFDGTQDTNDVQDAKNAIAYEDLTQEQYSELTKSDPQLASRILTEYNDRTIPEDNIAEMSRSFTLDDGRSLQIIDSSLSKGVATLIDTETGKEYVAYPNPLDRLSHMDGQQGQNDLGLAGDCGIAATAKSINDFYGKRVTDENRLVEYAYSTGNCEVKFLDNGQIDSFQSGGTNESNVVALYEANGIDAQAYTDGNVPSLEDLAEKIKDGEVATLAVNSDLLWRYDDARAFDFADYDNKRYLSDDNYRAVIDSYAKIQDGGTFRADHFVNVSGAVYDEAGDLSHFIVSDTGTGKTTMISRDDLQRAYSGLDSYKVAKQGCVVTTGKKA